MKYEIRAIPVTDLKLIQVGERNLQLVRI